MTKKKIVVLSVCSILQVFLFAGISAMYGWDLKFLTVSIAYYAETFLFLYYAADAKERLVIIFILALPPLMIYVPIHLISFEQTRVSLPGTVAHFFAIGLGAITYYIGKGYFRLLTVACFLAVTLCFFVYGYDKWLNNICYGSYTGTITEQAAGYSFADRKGHIVTMDNLKGDLVVLDFWNTACAACFKEFPAFQSESGRYLHAGKHIRFLAVNAPLKTDAPNQAEDALLKRGYTFQRYYLTNASDLKKFRVTFFPSIIILINGKEIVYRGGINGVDDIIKRYTAQ